MKTSRTRCGVASMGAALAITAVAAPTGMAKITEYPRDPSAVPVARAIVQDQSLIRRGVFSALPPSSRPAAVSTTPLAGFPRQGKSFAILSTGNAGLADDKNTATDSGTESRGPSIRGARDVVIMRVDLNVPKGADCLSFRFRFLSEEFPEFVHDIYNDAFIAEIDQSTWDASGKEDPTITAPRNFAQDAKGNPIRVNSVGDAGVTAAGAKGTTYDGATRVLRASTRVKPGLRRLYLSIFDQGDRIYDSAVFIDKLVVGKRSACATGAVVEK
jgi:hypothetical protein